MLEVQELTVRYGPVLAVDAASLSVAKGEIVALVGANGAGKSSLSNALIGLAPTSAGRVTFRGQDITQLPTPKRIEQGMACVLEGRGIFAELTVRENLELGAYVRSGRESRAVLRADLDEVTALFPRLTERYNQVAGTLSGGEQQMLVIGRALMTKPHLLILDEPSLGLAPRIVEEIADTLRLLARERGLTILVSEQNAVLGLDLADRAYVLHRGKIALQGSCEELRANSGMMDLYLGSAVSAEP